MSFKQPALAIAAAALFAVAGTASASAQEDCGSMYQRVMGAYQAQSPHYGQMVEHYNARCLSGGSAQPVWSGQDRHRYDGDRGGYDNRWGHENRWGYDNDRGHRGW